MSNDDLTTILTEYDKETKTQIDGIRANVENVIEEMKAALDLSLLSIPPSVRKMSMQVLLSEYGGCIEKATAALAPSTPKKRTPKKGIPLKSFQTASLSDLLAKKGEMESQGTLRRTPTRTTPTRGTPTKGTPTRGTPTRGRLPPRIPTPNKPKTPTKSPSKYKF